MSVQHALWSAVWRWIAFADALALRDRPLRDSFIGEYVATLLPVVEQTLDELSTIPEAKLLAAMHKLTPIDGDIAASIDALSDAELTAIVSDLLDVGRAVMAMVSAVELEPTS